mmetsp:Transcript_10244/g.21950  ORF Transcript_10244/g.21950 Transcript_10244/m.21950 type:complete len:265 (+) Transcript_10244:740-1534(+)
MCCQPVQQLIALLHDGEVSREVCVEHVVEARTTQGCNHLACLHRTWRQPHLLPYRHSHRGGRLHQHDLLLVLQQVQHVSPLLPLSERPHRAHADALATRDALGFFHGGLVQEAHVSVPASPKQPDHVHILDALAGGHAAAALYALVLIQVDGQAAVVLGLPRLVVLYVVGGALQQLGQAWHLVRPDEVLELAVATGSTRHTVLRVIGTQQCEHPRDVAPDLRGVGLHLHALGHRRHAGRAHAAVNLHQAQPACSGGLGQSGMFT